MFYVKTLSAVIVSILLWSAIALYGGLAGWWLSAIAPRNDSTAFIEAAQTLLEENSKGNVAMILIENGIITTEYFASSVDKIDRNTLFPTASMSKWITAIAVMTLVEQGKIDLDEPIVRYLSRWHLPDSVFDNNKVTVRGLLSHTAGLSDGLGFGDYEPGETLPTLEQSLAQPRASQGEKTISLGYAPGSEWDYSGGGYLILQLIVEEVSALKFKDLVQQNVFNPIDMSRSTYDYLGNFENISNSFDTSGNPATVYKYAASSATGLSSTAADLTRLVQSQLGDQNSASPLEQDTLADMRTPHGRMFGVDIWGLGTILYAPTVGGDFIYGHDGANDPAINSSVRINPDNGDAIIVLVTGHKSLATMLGFEWTLWQTGYPDFLLMDRAIESAYVPIACGILVIIICLIAFIFVRRAKIKNP